MPRPQRALLSIETAVLAALWLAWWVLSPSGLSNTDWQGLLLAATPLAIAAMAQSLPVIGGGQGLSSGATLVLGAAVATTLPISTTGEAIAAMACALAVGLAIGGINGVLIGIVGLRSTPVTIAMGAGTLALALQLSGESYRPSPEALGQMLFAPSIWGISIIPIAASVLICIAGEAFLRAGPGIALRKNRDADRDLYSNWPLCLAYILAGGGAGVGGVFLGAAFGSADVSLGAPVLLQVLAAISVGGGVAGLSGGSVLGAMLGALIVTSTGNLLVPLGITDQFSTIIDASWLLSGTIMALATGARTKIVEPHVLGHKGSGAIPRAMTFAVLTAMIGLCWYRPDAAGLATLTCGLAMLAVGQLAVLRCGTLDLSMPSLIAASAVTTVTLTQGEYARLPSVCAGLLLFAIAFGLLWSWLSTKVGRTILVFPLMLAGCAQAWIAYLLVDFPTGFAPPELTAWTYRTWIGVPISAWVLLGVTLSLVWLGLVRRAQAFPFVFSAAASVLFGIGMAGFGGTAQFSLVDTYFLPALAAGFLSQGLANGRAGGVLLAIPVVFIIVAVDTMLLFFGAGYALRIIVIATGLILGEGFRASGYRRQRAMNRCEAPV